MRKRILGLLITVGAFSYTATNAQTAQEKDQALAWHTANKNTVKLVTYTEYSQLSPEHKAEIDALEAKIIYDEKMGLTWQDIQTYEANKDIAKIEEQDAQKRAYEEANMRGEHQKGSYLNQVSATEQYEQKMKNEQVDIWRQNNENVKLISIEQYQALSPQDRAEINSVANKIIYVGKLTWEDIEAYEAMIKR